MTGCVPGSEPSPPQVAHVTATSNGTDTLAPVAACASSISTSAQSSLKRARGWHTAEHVVAEERGEEIAQPTHVELCRAEAAEQVPVAP